MVTGWGCALCLYSKSFCFCVNEGLLSVLGAPLFRLQELKETNRNIKSNTEMSPPPLANTKKLHLSAEDIALPSSQNSQSQTYKSEESILSPVKNILRRSDSEVIASPVKKSLDFSSASPSPAKSLSQHESQSHSLLSSPYNTGPSLISQSAFDVLPTPTPLKSPTKTYINNNYNNTMGTGRAGLMQSTDFIPFMPVQISEKTDQFYSEAYCDDIEPSIESDFDLSARSSNVNTTSTM